MKLMGEKIITMSQEKVWRALNDPETLRQSIPGCESFEKISDNSYRAIVTSKIGPVQARFTGNVTLSDLDPPNGYVISGQGSGGTAGSAKGSAKVHLETAPGGTRLTWNADAQISGKLAQIGSRLVESTANMMAGQFFDRFQQVVGGEKPKETSIRIVPAWAWIAGVFVLIIIAIAVYFLWR